MTIADDARALVARTTTAQGVPRIVADRQTLARVAGILLTAKGNAGPEQAGVATTVTTTVSERGGRRHGT